MSEKIISEANLNKAGTYPGWKAKAAADKAAADAAQAAKTEVTVTQVQGSTNGTKIATIGVDSVSTDVYAPAVAVTQVQGSTGGTKIATVAVGATSTDIYAPAASGAERIRPFFEISFTLTIDGDPSTITGFTIDDADTTPAELYAAFQSGAVIDPMFLTNEIDTISQCIISFEESTADQIPQIGMNVAMFALTPNSPDENDGIVFFSIVAPVASEDASDWSPVSGTTGYRFFDYRNNA